MVYKVVYEMVYRGVVKNGGDQNIMETSALRIIFMFLTLVMVVSNGVLDFSRISF
jgi:hypothetical protein